jgi:hypothetical protein
MDRPAETFGAVAFYSPPKPKEFGFLNRGDYLFLIKTSEKSIG